MKKELGFINCLYLFNVEEIPAHISEFYEEVRNGLRNVNESIVYQEYLRVYEYVKKMSDDDVIFNEKIKKYSKNPKKLA